MFPTRVPTESSRTGMFVLFISHQWLGSAHPDPQGAQLSVLRIALQRMVDGVLAVEEDLKLAG